MILKEILTILQFNPQNMSGKPLHKHKLVKNITAEIELYLNTKKF